MENRIDISLYKVAAANETIVFAEANERSFRVGCGKCLCLRPLHSPSPKVCVLAKNRFNPQTESCAIR